ncbi:MAG: phosphoribosylglycinamide formyltransferase [Papillibacter sp.]|jgi:phosphoribosylglycinamide formyltransferase-1|nr:phosphoribosylglycinamide formyltransferase [Papillibacter sp.]
MLKAQIAVMVSGGGTNLQALIDAQKAGRLKSGEIALVVSNKKGAYALTRAEAAGIPAFYIEKEGFEDRLSGLLAQYKIDLIILAGFLRIFTKNFTDKWPKRIINVHPALIPSFCGNGYYGLRVHEEALKYGVKLSGATVHYANEVTDGGEIILQKAVKVYKKDTPETLQRRVMEQCEWVLLPKAAELVSKKILKEKGLKNEGV